MHTFLGNILVWVNLKGACQLVPDRVPPNGNCKGPWRRDFLSLHGHDRELVKFSFLLLRIHYGTLEAWVGVCA